MRKTVAIVIFGFVLTLSGCHSSRQSASAPGSPKYEVPEVEFSAPQKGIDPKMAVKLEKEARKWIGTRYKYGGQSRKGTDCSGMVMVIFDEVAGIKLPRDSRSQQQFCKPVKKDKLAPGDLVFFSTGKNSSRVSHVGLYIGKGDFIHASTSSGVIVSNLSQKYYATHYHSGGRVPSLKEKKLPSEVAAPAPSQRGAAAPAVPQPRVQAPKPSSPAPEIITECDSPTVLLPIRPEAAAISETPAVKPVVADTTESPARPLAEPAGLADSIRTEVRRAMKF